MRLSTTGETSDMMRAGSLPAQRRFELIRLAQRQGQLSVAELSAQFRVSADTIRRDLDLLSVGGFVRRTHALEELEVQVLVAPPLNSNHRPKSRPRTLREPCGTVKFVSVSP